MEELLEILKSLHPDVDFEKETNIVDNDIIDSLDIVVLIGEIKDKFDVLIPSDEIISENFNSAKDIYKLICRLSEGDI